MFQPWIVSEDEKIPVLDLQCRSQIHQQIPPINHSYMYKSANRDKIYHVYTYEMYMSVHVYYM